MTPKEKAKELFDQMYKSFDPFESDEISISESDRKISDILWEKNREEYEKTYKVYAKKCALIAVDEILIYCSDIYDREFMEKVKQEIEAL